MSSENTSTEPPNSSSSPTSLRRCHGCGRTQDEEIRLQKCAGCHSVLYCSKACQKEKWEMHRLFCRNDANPKPGRNQQLQEIGFESVSAFTKALGRWFNAHKSALQTCADVVVAEAGGIEASRNPQKMVGFSLEPRVSKNLPPTRNPSRMFQLRGRCLISLEEHLSQTPGHRRDWECCAPVRAAMDEQFARNPLYTGLLPILISVIGVHMTQITYLPQMRSDPTLLRGAVIVAPPRHIIFQDAVRLAVCSINENFPLRIVEHDPLAIAIPGRFMHDNGSWTWKELFPDWSHYRRGRHRGIDVTLAKMRSGLPPPELILAMKSLVS
ncbi:hypothetical protein L226DRAFT_572222 [Lentinus tigrinus ALCF2SS1-7]|uniref:MYND-type domain-containing protein n=1 Tax=Lentinus tigrinus ALCF2SS1-6 TaxID=1328759 RepID=A0A5C2S670_9APHY|nr:hypothetical protein L227DRAFT_612210 [Lentinus tigrinus ALCF2SS1-6]RPD73557.1 hypothetical protein L226DRAFT_572222 [Lentinus tigrinus ALCF2SS1-7]